MYPHGRTEASLSYLGERDWNEMRLKRSNMISMWNTIHMDIRTYLFEIEPAELRVATVTRGVRLLPASGPSPNKPSTFLVCLRHSNSEHLFSYGMPLFSSSYGIFTGFSRYNTARRCGDSVGRVYFQRNERCQCNIQRLLYDGGPIGEMCRTKVRYCCSLACQCRYM